MVKKVLRPDAERHDWEACRLADQIARRDHRPRQMAIAKSADAYHRWLGQPERPGVVPGLRAWHGTVERVAHLTKGVWRLNLQIDRPGIHTGRIG